MATAVVNLALVGWLVTPPVDYVAETGMDGIVNSLTLLIGSGPLLTAVMLPVAAMMYVATRPAPTPVSR